MLHALVLLLPLLCVLCLFAQDGPRPDVLVADFEGDGWGDWRVTGEVFGDGPARGDLPGEAEVSGYAGDGFVSSLRGGEGTKGTLTSPAFRVERCYLSFLIGGGGYEGSNRVELLHGGEVVRTATGPNTRPGGSRTLEPFGWDVADLQGELVELRVVAARKAGWGNVQLDHVVQTDARPRIAPRPGRLERELAIDRRYLLLPVHDEARATRLDLLVDGRPARQLDVELAGADEEPAFWAFLDLADLRGRRAMLVLSDATEAAAARIRLADAPPEPEDLYDEPLRPQLRFSQRVGWNNDPNGMVYADGEWHLFFQHNPFGRRWGNMQWGHAVSRDLLHWEQLPVALRNRSREDLAYSGGAVVDARNTSGWRTGEAPLIVASWTSTGRGECLSYSNDRGRTFTEYEGNPVLRHQGRDPRLVWYAPGAHWVMVVYDQVGETPCLAFHVSKDLKEWRLASRLEGWFECPELFELPVDGDPDDTRWVVFAADARYALGRFDGETFTPLHEGKHVLHHGAYYASQTFSGAPDGRRVQVGWARVDMPGMRFNQAFSFPAELSLRTTPEGVRLFAEPVRELGRLNEREWRLAERALTEDAPARLAVEGELFDVRARFRIGAARVVGLELGGDRVAYDATERLLCGAALAPTDGEVELRVLVDRPMLEVFGARGRAVITRARSSPGALPAITAFAEGGEATLLELEARGLRSIWADRRAAGGR